jgi:hypothetical protein
LTNLNAANLGGTLSDARLSANVALLGANQTFTGSNTFKGAVLLTNAANSFAGKFFGNGTGLTNLNADLLDGLQATQFWKLAGNSGTTPGNFLGTTDNRALELKVNSDRGLRLEPLATSPNLIGGSRSNAVAAGVAGAAIGGGGTTASPNLIASDFGTVSGGIQNTIQGSAVGAAVSGGGTNTIEAGSQYSVIGGGGGNRIQASGQYSRIGGGSGNVIQTNASGSTIAGGSANVIQQGAANAVVGGGRLNAIGASSSFAAIGGGLANGVSASYGAIAGGRTNTIQAGSDDAVIGGGWANTVQASAGHAVIAGGSGNTIQGGASVATIGGGSGNQVTATGPFATVPGGTGASADKYGQLAYASGSFGVAGDAQTSAYVLRGSSSATQEGELFLDGASRRLTVPNNCAWMFEILMVGRRTGGAVHGLVIRGAVANKSGTMTSWVGAPDSAPYGDAGLWTATVTTGSQALIIKGRLTDSADTVRWVAAVHTAEVRW